MRPELQHAARTGDVGALEAELAAGADVNSFDRHGQTALMLAAHNGHLAAVDSLVRHGAELDVRAKFGLSALMLAIVAGHEPVARRLVRAGADMTIRGAGAPGFAGKSAIDLAGQQGMKELSSEMAARSEAASGDHRR